MSEPSPTADESPPGHDPYAALRVRDFRLYLGGNFISLVGMQMQTMAVSWQIFQRTQSNYAVGMVGLVQVLPVISLALFAGHVADRMNRKYLVMMALLVVAAASVGLTVADGLRDNWTSVLWMYGFLFVTGIARAFLQPGKQSLMPQLVPRDRFTSAITWNAGAFHLAAVMGPALSGGLIAILGGATLAFVTDAVAALLFVGLLIGVRHEREELPPQALTWQGLLGGVNFVGKYPLILGAMTLDMFAVLLGGAVALFPYYSEKVLHVGATGLGWMQAAPAVGSVIMSFILSRRPPMERAGRNLIWSVAGFGLATIAFGLSHSLWFSLAMLFVTGALDTISVVVRHSLVLLHTPNAMRGRVSAINGMFISISNELGGYESGTVAALFTPVISVVSGGIGTLVVVAIAAWRVPELRRYGRLDGGAPEPISETITSTEAESQGI